MLTLFTILIIKFISFQWKILEFLANMVMKFFFGIIVASTAAAFWIMKEAFLLICSLIGSALEGIFDR